MSFPILGLTGPSGAGKGVVAKRLSVVHGFAWIDTDAVYHELISAPSACLDELVEAFGKDILTPDGALHRPALAAIVFDPENKDKLELLNAITHCCTLLSSRRSSVESYRAILLSKPTDQRRNSTSANIITPVN